MTRWRHGSPCFSNISIARSMSAPSSRLPGVDSESVLLLRLEPQEAWRGFTATEGGRQLRNSENSDAGGRLPGCRKYLNIPQHTIADEIEHEAHDERKPITPRTFASRVS